MYFIIGVIFFVPVAIVIAFGEFLLRKRRVNGLEDVSTFKDYLRGWVKAHPINLACCVALLLVPTVGPFLGVGLIVVSGVWRMATKQEVKFFSKRQMKKRQADSNHAWLEFLGPNHQRRLEVIEDLYEERTANVGAQYFAEWVTHHKGAKKHEYYVDFSVSRSLAVMDNREREYLKIVDLLNSAADGQEDLFVKWRAALIWGDGKGVLGQSQWVLPEGVPTGRAVPTAIDEKAMSVDQTITAIQQRLANLRTTSNLDVKFTEVLEYAGEHAAPTGKVGWLKSSDLAGTIFAPNGSFPVHIGSFADGTPLTYSGEGSMVTIAPPGAGKTQCNVFPNLLSWRGPAVVLDISGDIFEHTAAWREANIGPVYKFSPLEPEHSHRYNPLTFVRREPDYIWEDARLLAEMMIVPALSSDPFWENEARTVLTSAIAYVCYYNSPAERPMHAVLDVLFGGKAWDDMLRGLSMAVDVRVMTQHATALEEMNEKTRSSVLQTARSSLGAWSGERVARATSASDWDPMDLRNGTNPTIYIYVRPNEVEAYLSMLRVFIGQHIRMLTGGAVPAHGSAPILFMLDELPRLRYMAPVDEALNIGRKYGLRLWMFAQSVGQLQTAYENADGMLGSCAVRIFMNPSGADGMAERVSAELGEVDSIADNSRRRLVDAVELAGPAFKQQQIVIGVGTKPARVSKDFAYNDPELNSRMAMPAPAVAEVVRQ